MLHKSIPCRRNKVAAGKPGARAHPNQYTTAFSPKTTRSLFFSSTAVRSARRRYSCKHRSRGEGEPRAEKGIDKTTRSLFCSPTAVRGALFLHTLVLGVCFASVQAIPGLALGEGRAAHCARRLPGCGPRSLHSLSPPGPPLRSLVGLRRIPPKYLLTYFSIPYTKMSEPIKT